MNDTSRRKRGLLRIGLSASLGALAMVLLLSSVAAAPIAPHQAAPLPQNSIIEEVITQIITETLVHDLAGLTGQRPVTVAGSLYTITTRNTTFAEAISMTTRYAHEQFEGYGVDVSYHTYTFDDELRRNVVAEQAGLIQSKEIYLITAHVDDMPKNDPAPGADDNGTGSVAVMTAARLLGTRHFVHTLRFVLFTGEEQGLLGSEAYAADCKRQGENIRGVVNLDMIGYNTRQPVFDAYARKGTSPGASESRQLAEVFSNTIATHNLELIPHRIDLDDYPLKYGSDQWSFLKQGYPAILVIEDYAGGDFTPHYHTVSDTIDTLDLGYYADVTRASVATLAHLGQPLPSDAVGQLSGTVRNLETWEPLSATTVTAFWPTYGYTFTARSDAHGAYSATLPVGNYTITVRPSADYQALITHTHISTGAITIQDIGLRPWIRLYLPHVVRDA